jgi:SAM-dependent methyltransferase
MTKKSAQEIFWNTDGGSRWVQDIDRLEAMLLSLSEKLITEVAATRGEHILDIGCGGGVTSAALAAATGPDGQVLGADISGVILDVAKARYTHVTNLNFTAADAAHYAFEAGRYDVITSRFGVMFFPEPDVAFANLFRAGKSGGRIVFICWRGLAENPWMGAPAAAAFAVVPPPEKPAPGAPGAFSLANAAHVKQIMDDAGFTDIKLSPIDEMLNLGELDAALDFMTELGPAAEPLREATDEQRIAAIAAMRVAMNDYDTDRGLVMPSAVWLVEARIP